MLAAHFGLGKWLVDEAHLSQPEVDNEFMNLAHFGCALGSLCCSPVQFAYKPKRHTQRRLKWCTST